MIFNILTNFVAIFIFLFLLWKKLKEDYVSSQIFNVGIYILFFIALSNYLSVKYIPEYWFWSIVLGVFIGLIVGIIRYRFRFFETLEAIVISIIPWYGLYFFSDAIGNNNLSSLLGSIIIIGLVVVYAILDKHYKRFSWYKSGKVGFSGLSILGLLFIIRAIVAISFENVISFAERYDAILSAIFAFSSFLAVFHLARQKT